MALAKISAKSNAARRKSAKPKPSAARLEAAKPKPRPSVSRKQVAGKLSGSVRKPIVQVIIRETTTFDVGR